MLEFLYGNFDKSRIASMCKELAQGIVYFKSKSKSSIGFNSFLAGNFCCLLIAFVKSLDPGQDRRFVGPVLGLSRLTL